MGGAVVSCPPFSTSRVRKTYNGALALLRCPPAATPLIKHPRPSRQPAHPGPLRQPAHQALSRHPAHQAPSRHPAHRGTSQGYPPTPPGTLARSKATQ
ncbi:hypothetical protein NEOLEDRAFT_1129497 [Neolentinus lepideus HHB14362 ss-1]|uniref:Uncharacterized protein n=1 Tax=Neolentinus lepideus HHB14362 ss-1 TaxID=1314782 RepID=A0A165UHV6_9AGAM|nr:hypothetical protein NEOLEDRAFT_1129497 [Neolentinus lepideus HHB14362 ss-1]